ncbi:TIGR03618 family F420-dependent PPOX class oxidoreductase [Dietzia sp.]|uniref:TIGR03618 family F420-dependent PPOX class oxidoreductase n=1 Tax=Dietzia sp. TaxID=1871616 RepID=UPI002FD8F871
MASPSALSAQAHEFLEERHLGTLTTQRRDGSPHVTAAGFTFDPVDGTARVICSARSQKAANARRGGRAVVAQVEGRLWLSLEGPVRLLTSEGEVRRAERLYAARYKNPRPNPLRVVVEIRVDRVLGAASLLRAGDDRAGA